MKLKKVLIFLFGGLILIQSALCAGEDAMNKEGTKGNQGKATFAGGCFWCIEPPFDKLEGVISTTPGYTGGAKKNPTYEEVSTGKTGHAEAVEIVFDPAKIRYEKLLEVFWHNIDPTQLNQQFADRGTQYRTAIYYHDENQKRLAEASKTALEKSGKFNKPIVTEIVPASEFYPAEKYHHDYYKKNPDHYEMYSWGSGRKPFIEKTWAEEKKPKT